MLETPQERVKLLRAGFTGRTIERLYIKGNNFKIVRTPIRIELVEIDNSRTLGIGIGGISNGQNCSEFSHVA